MADRGEVPQSEASIQLAFRKQAKWLCPKVAIVAIPNAGKRTVWAAQQLKRDGMATGFPDLMCLFDGRTAFIEFKTPKGRLSDNQAEWLDRLTAMGFPCTVARSPQQALDWLRCVGAPFIDREGRL